jgi:lysozyme
VTTPLLIADLQRDEGFRERAYQDEGGVWTIGYGHTPAQPGECWIHGHALAQLEADASAAEEELDRELGWWRRLDEVRQDALANMAFNIGVRGLLGFHHMLEALAREDFAHASAQMLLSEWASQVGDRAQRLAHMIRTGSRP